VVSISHQSAPSNEKHRNREQKWRRVREGDFRKGGCTAGGSILLYGPAKKIKIGQGKGRWEKGGNAGKGIGERAKEKK